MKSEEFPASRRKEGLAVMKQIPVVVTVSRKTGQVIGAERATVKEKDFQKICQALIDKGGGKEGRETCRDGKRTE